MATYNKKCFFEPFSITGMGVVSPYGGGNALFAEGIGAQRSGIKPLSLFSEKQYEYDHAGEIGNYNPESVIGKKGLRGMSRLTLILMESLTHLISDSSIKVDGEWTEPLSAPAVSMILGTLGSIEAESRVDFQAIENPAYMVPSDFPGALACVPAGYAAIRFKIKGATNTLSNGENSSLDAIAFGGHQLTSRKMDLVIAGGVEELSLQYALIMQGVAKRNSMPNPILGEGSVVFSCERKEDAIKRKAKILAEVIAYSTGFHPDNSIAFRNNIASLKEQIGEELFSKIDTVFVSEKNIDLEEKKFSGKKCLAITPFLGFMHSATGAFKIATAVVSPSIPCDSLILINDVSCEGNASSMIIKKVNSNEA